MVLDNINTWDKAVQRRFYNEQQLNSDCLSYWYYDEDYSVYEIIVDTEGNVLSELKVDGQCGCGQCREADGL